MPLDTIFCTDSRRMAALADASVQLVVTSPPYNVGKAYATHDDNLPLDAYLAYLNEVWRECYRVLVPGGRLCINVANTDRKPYLPLNALITAELLRLARDEGQHWQMRGEIIWDKGSSVGISTAWGSFASSSDPVLRDVHEYIMIFSKEQFRLPTGGKTGISGGEFVDWTRSIWRPEEVNSPQSAVTSEKKAEADSRSLAELQRKLAGKLREAQKRGKDDSWTAESLARAAWQYFSQSGNEVWWMTTESGIAHPAPFPVELPRRLIKLYTQPGDIVLDPFMGAGATAVAAVQTGRHYIGYDVSEAYCALAQARIKKVEKETSRQENRL